MHKTPCESGKFFGNTARPRYIVNPATGDVREDRARYLQAAIERFHRAGLLVMVEIHNEDRAVELDPAWQDAFVRFWGLLAARLSRFDPELTILEIINEPVFDRREEEWNTLNARLAAVIRQNTPQHTIVTSGPNWGGIDGLNKLKLLPDRNVIYSFHCYDPSTFTHRGARRQPLRLGGMGLGRGLWHQPQNREWPGGGGRSSRQSPGVEGDLSDDTLIRSKKQVNSLPGLPLHQGQFWLLLGEAD